MGIYIIGIVVTYCFIFWTSTKTTEKQLLFTQILLSVLWPLHWILFLIIYFKEHLMSKKDNTEMGFFSRLFNPIDTNYSPETKEIYNKGVIALSKGNIKQAINYFERVNYEHPSAAYNLGLIYLDGAGCLVPNYDKARQYFQQADEMGHKKAKQSAEIIGLNEEVFYSLIPNPNNEILQERFIKSSLQFFEGGQYGNLAYILAHMFILWNENFTSYSYPRVFLDKEKFKELITEFITYEVYCIRNFSNKEINQFYQVSSLTHVNADWEHFYPLNMFLKRNTEAELSEYFNLNAVPLLLGIAKQFHKKNLKLEDFGVLRLMVVNYVYEYCINKFGKDFFDIDEDDNSDDESPF